MSEELKPEVTPVAPDVEEKPVEAVEKQVETVAEPAAKPAEAPAAEAVEAPAAESAAEAAEKPAEPADFAGKTLAELSSLFEKLTESVDRMKRSKEAEAIKSAFYRKLSREKFLSGLGAAVDEPSDSEEPEAIEAINHITDIPIDDGRNVGIKNSIYRLKYYYGEAASVVCDSEINIGTTFTITIPYNLEEE